MYARIEMSRDGVYIRRIESDQRRGLGGGVSSRLAWQRVGVGSRRRRGMRAVENVMMPVRESKEKKKMNERKKKGVEMEIKRIETKKIGDIAGNVEKRHKEMSEGGRMHMEEEHGLVKALVSAFRVWEWQSSGEGVTEEAMERAVEKAEEKEKEKEVPAVEIEPFLRAVGILELKHLRMLSNLCSLTYFMDTKVTKESLQRRHRLSLVTTSVECEQSLKEQQQSAMAVFLEGDGMAGDVMVTPDQEEEQVKIKESRYASVSNSMENGSLLYGKKGANRNLPGEVGSALALAASAAASAALGSKSPKPPINSLPMGNIAYFTGLYSEKETKASENSPTRKHEPKYELASAGPASPTEWFVADDDVNHVRYIVIQGSDNIDHWRLNLTFDPVIFEDPALGVKAHRGVYQAAKQLYHRFLPLVEDHLSKYPDATIAFTGHSLGGSLGTMLMMMLLHRGVLKPSNLAPVHTFGAPAVFCGGEACCGSCSMANGRHEGVLEKLGLPHDAVRNVMMHRDIVPRAFACDYSLVADFLKSVHESFRSHHCLSGNRRVMFNSIGQTLILQPDEKSTFVAGEGYHPLLPQKPGIFALKYSSSGPIMAEQRDSMEMQEGKKMTRVASSSDEAFWELMNCPHPLDTLGDPGSYGDTGAISRYHNPDNYTRALGGALKARGEQARRIAEHARKSRVAYRPAVDKNRRNDVMVHSSAGGKYSSPIFQRE